ncbi:hypothetical protein [Mycobacteroides chelonae]|uniref:hypothetical protein n=1 Tax=Mycobacteroides chelonae TaxID=1774 RepID=UPI0018B0848A|nr:hypothetical protein [Mycobacteroides chelonae]MBF9318574.1 hypothetical protein [Mycobacteroides chelonae]
MTAAASGAGWLIRTVEVTPGSAALAVLCLPESLPPEIPLDVVALASARADDASDLCLDADAL